MEIKTFAMLFVIFLLLLPSLTALSLNGNRLSPIIFKPGLNISNHYTITDTSKEVNVKVGGELEEYIHITEVINNEFDMIINFPEYIAPGSYRFGLTAEEIPSGSQEGISALTSVSKQFKVEVYSYDQYIDISLSAPSVNEGTPIDFQLSVSSKGYKDINSISGEIEVFDGENNTLGKVKTKKKPLKALSSEKLTATFKTIGLPADEYLAKGTVFYDGQQKTATAIFRIGQMDLILKNYTSKVEQGFSEYVIEVINNWGNDLKNVHAKLFIDGEELLDTPTIQLDAWEEGKLEGIIKVDKDVGTYPGELELFFEGETKNETISIEVVSAAKDLNLGIGEIILIVLIVVMLLLIGVITTLLVIRRKEKKIKWKKKDEFED